MTKQRVLADSSVWTIDELGLVQPIDPSSSVQTTHDSSSVQTKDESRPGLPIDEVADLCSSCNLEEQYTQVMNMVAEYKTNLKIGKESKLSRMIKKVNNENCERPNEGKKFQYGSHIPVKDVKEKPYGGIKYCYRSQSLKPERKKPTVSINISEARKKCLKEKDFRKPEQGVCERNPTEKQISGRGNSFFNENYRSKSEKQNPITITKESKHMQQEDPVIANCHQNDYNVLNICSFERSNRNKNNDNTCYQKRKIILSSRKRLPRKRRSDSQTRTRVLYRRKYDCCRKSDEDTNADTKVKQGHRKYNYTNMKEIEHDNWDTRCYVTKENEYNNEDKNYDVLKEKHDGDKRCKVNNGHGKRESKDKTWKEKECDKENTSKEDKHKRINRSQYSKDKQYDQPEYFENCQRTIYTCKAYKKETSPKENHFDKVKDPHDFSESIIINRLNKCEKSILKKEHQSKSRKQQKSEKESCHKVIQKKCQCNQKMICKKRSSKHIAIRIEADNPFQIALETHDNIISSSEFEDDDLCPRCKARDEVIALDTSENIISSSDYKDDDLCPYCKARDKLQRVKTVQRLLYANISKDSKNECRIKGCLKGAGRNSGHSLSPARKTVVDDVQTKATQSEETNTCEPPHIRIHSLSDAINIRGLCNYLFGTLSESTNAPETTPCNDEIITNTTCKNEEHKEPEEKIINTKETSKTHVSCEESVLENIFSQINSIKSDVKSIKNSKKKDSKVLKVESLIRENNDLKRHFEKLEKCCQIEREKCRIMWERMAEAEDAAKAERIDMDEINENIAAILERIQQQEVKVVGKFNSFAQFTCEYRNILSDYYKNVSARADQYFDTKQKNIDKKEEKMNLKYETLMQMIEEETKKLNARLERFREKVDEYENQFENQKRSLEMKRHTTNVQCYEQYKTNWSEFLENGYEKYKKKYETAGYDRKPKQCCPGSAGRSRYEYKTNQFVYYEELCRPRESVMCRSPRHRNSSLRKSSLHKPSLYKPSLYKSSLYKSSLHMPSLRKPSLYKPSHRKSSVDLFKTTLNGSFSGICITKYCELKEKRLCGYRGREETEKDRHYLLDRITEFVTGNSPEAARSMTLPSTMTCRHQWS